MKNGIIMEIKRDILVMMTSEGEFLTGRRQPDQHYTIGEEIPFFPLHHESAMAKPFFKWNWKVSTALLTTIIIILTLFSSGFLQNNQAYAYVSVDINPSMELTLNEKQQVIKITPYNQDAKVLLEELGGWENMDVSEVTEEIFLLCEEMGYLKENQNVLITSSFIEDSNGEREDDLVAEINKFVQEYSTDHNMNITVKETSQEMREEASDKGMTAGSLLQETEEADTPKPAGNPKEDSKDQDVLNEGMKKEENSKVENHNVKLPSEEKKQKPAKPENHPKNNKPLPNENKPQEKPAQSQDKGNSSDHHKRNESNGRHNGSSKQGDKDQSRGNENRNNHEKNNNEKKNDHQERKENKKDRD
ncbi:anti-sigma factor domain-containing protein [Rossellomorea aquimaris]|nr:anti-sigma factor domain-containing protein [Rossellomorea aquimaris]WRP08202.1 anti-sigma factor domain-containing protein [Rossellomorea aquimaris]